VRGLPRSRACATPVARSCSPPTAPPRSRSTSSGRASRRSSLLASIDSKRRRAGGPRRGDGRRRADRVARAVGSRHADRSADAGRRVALREPALDERTEHGEREREPPGVPSDPHTDDERCDRDVATVRDHGQVRPGSRGVPGETAGRTASPGHGRARERSRCAVSRRVRRSLGAGGCATGWHDARRRRDERGDRESRDRGHARSRRSLAGIQQHGLALSPRFARSTHRSPAPARGGSRERMRTAARADIDSAGSSGTAGCISRSSRATPRWRAPGCRTSSMTTTRSRS
jgi:hypothetical protein